MKKDRDIISQYKKAKPWGLLTSIDLYQCNPEIIRNAKKIKKFVVKLCELIDMKRFGEPVIVNFGEDPRVSGYSMTQLIETSLISGHFANQTNTAYIDIFSCKEYPSEKATKFCQKFFEAKKARVSTTFRY